MISGVFAVVYFAPYGVWGLVLPFLTMAAACLIVVFGVNGARRLEVYEYAGYAHSIYGRFAKILAPLLEVYIILAMVVGGSAVITMGGIFFNNLFHLPELWGEIVMALLSTLLVLRGDGLVRKSSVFMTIVLIAGFFILILIGTMERLDKFSRIIREWEIPAESPILAGISGAFFLGLSNASNGITLSSVSQKLKSFKDCMWVGLISFILNSLCFIGCTILVLPYMPEILQESVPNLYIINNFLIKEIPYLPALYSIVMLFGLVSSGVPQLHAVASRVLKIYPHDSFRGNKMLKNFLTSVIYMTLCILISFLGLRRIIGQGYSLLGKLSIPLIVLPVCVILPIRLHFNTLKDK
jgi:uncharacterized membrane protein YkvI